MKKTRFIALVLVAAVMMMGAGYAYWTDALTVNNTVDTGELRVEFGEYNANKWSGKVHGEAKYMKLPVVTDKNQKTISCTLSDLFPGDGRAFMSVQIINKGTVPAKLANAEVAPHATTQMKNNINVMVTVHDNEGKRLIIDGQDKDWKGTLENLNEVIENAFGDAEIGVGETYQLRIAYDLSKDAENNLENQTANPSIKLNWKQYNQE